VLGGTQRLATPFWPAFSHPPARGLSTFHEPKSYDRQLVTSPLTCFCALCSGADLGTETVLRVTEADQEFVFQDVPEAPVPSLLRGFSGAGSCARLCGASSAV
jgi:hypothetical protein